MARAKQGHLPEMAPDTIAEIDSAAEAYVEKRNAWQRAKGPMEEAYAILEAAMKTHRKRVYEYDGKRVEYVTGKTHIKVREAKIELPEEDDDDEENGDGDE